MANNSINVLIPIAVCLGFAVIIYLVVMLASKILRPHEPNELKNSAYECGEQPIGTAWSMFNVRFYVVGLIFIIFDVESVLMFPVVSVFKKLNAMGMGGVVLIEILLFIGILVAGIAYCWSKGDLDWVKSYQPAKKK
ncbi:MAG: NADH-quinone oxidoreductase subunit A [Bacteriovoracaceae bacterium]|jgi:NADH-quinone oxidoreductase subunit A|nr:NADH-quinone oxidoreductase subunit A [Bacteriovoracaceae bacterium]